MSDQKAMIGRQAGINQKTSLPREENDFYATDPEAIIHLMKIETLQKRIWEPACGQGHLSRPLIRAGFYVKCTDLIDRGYGEGGVDFFKQQEPWDGDIITNPPYKCAVEFIEHALDIISEGSKVCVFLKLNFLEGAKRRQLFEKNPPKTVWVSSHRINCGRNGDFSRCASMMAQAWFIFEKGYHGQTTLKWFN